MPGVPRVTSFRAVLVVGALALATAPPSTTAQTAISCPAGMCCGTEISSCTNCTRGSYKAEAGTQGCDPCPIGTAASQYGLTACEKCGPGFAAGTTGSVVCVPCPFGSYASGFASPSCTACPEGRTTLLTGSTSLGDCVCRDGFAEDTGAASSSSSSDGSSALPTSASSSGTNATGLAECVACPENAVCAGGRVLPEEGFWASESDPTNIFECAPRSACTGGGTCAEGYRPDSRLCSDCSDRHFKQYRIDTCSPCPFTGWGWVLVALTPIVLVCIALLVLTYARVPTIASVYLLVTFLQVSALLGDFNVDWPLTLPFVFTVLSAFNLNQDLFGFQCELSFTSRYALDLLLPVALTLIYLVLYGISRALAPKRRAFYVPKNLPGKPWEHFFHSWLMLALLSFVFLTSTFVSVIDCRGGENGTLWLEIRPDTQCGSSEWVSLAVPGLLAFIVYVVFPVGACFSYLYKMRKIDPLDRNEVRYGFLFMRFRDKYFYWEAVNMTYKFVLVLLTKLMSARVVFCVILGTVISLGMAIAHLKFRPYRTRMDNNLAIAVFVGHAYMMVITLVFRSSSIGSSASNIVTALAIIVIIALVMFASGITTLQARILRRVKDPSADSRWHTARKQERRDRRRRKRSRRATKSTPNLAVPTSSSSSDVLPPHRTLLQNRLSNMHNEKVVRSAAELERLQSETSASDVSSNGDAVE